MQHRFCSTAIQPKAKSIQLRDATCKDSSEKCLQFFKSYVQDGGKRIHPTLGDLSTFVSDIEADWDQTEGMNPVSAFLQERFDLREEALHQALLDASTTLPLKAGLNYFREYFNAGGKVTHPVLGDLREFVTQIDAIWDKERHKMNLVSVFLNSRFPAHEEEIQTMVFK